LAPSTPLGRPTTTPSAPLAEALGRLLAGERDSQTLRRGLALDAIDEQALTLVEGAVADAERWALLERLAEEARGAESGVE